MNIIWQYLDKRSAAINALKDYSSMAYIIEHTDEEIANIHDDMTSIGSPAFSDTPSNASNPKSGEIRLTATIDEIDVLHERYRQAKEERANQKATAELEAQKQKYISLLSELTRVESESAKITDKAQQGISRFTQNTRLLSAQIESLTVSYGDNERKMPSLIGRISNLTERQKLLKEQIENSQKKVNALNSAVSASQDVYDAAVKKLRKNVASLWRKF